MRLKKEISQLEGALAQQLKSTGIATPVREYRFCRDEVGHGPGIRARLARAQLKDWRFDFAWPSAMFAVEVEGGAYVMGRHNRGQGFEDDLQKYHTGMLLGWTIYRCSGSLIKSGQALQIIEKILESGGRA